MKKILVSCVIVIHFSLFTFHSSLLHAQQASTEIENLLQSQTVTYAQAARFILQASEKETIYEPELAFLHAKEKGWLPKNASAEQEARLDGVSLLLMQSFDQKGGAFYSMTKNARYAYRELLYKKIIQGRSDPAMKVSGEQLLFITNRMLAQKERQEELAEIQRRKKAEADEKYAALLRREDMARSINAALASQNVANTTVEATSEGVMITLSNIQFIAESAQLPTQERAKLTEVSAILKTVPNIKLLVTGHTARAGDDDSQTTLSYERAQSVANYLIAQGVCRPADITAVGLGSDKPIADNATEAGRAQNRRVEITILE